MIFNGKNSIVKAMLLFMLSGLFLYYYIFYIEDFLASTIGLIVYVLGMFGTQFLYVGGKYLIAKLGGFSVIYYRIFSKTYLLTNGEFDKSVKPITNKEFADVKFAGKGNFLLSFIGGFIITFIGVCLCIYLFFGFDNLYLECISVSLFVNFGYVLINNTSVNNGKVISDGGKLWVYFTDKEYKKILVERLAIDYDLANGIRYKDLNVNEVDFVGNRLYLAHLIDDCYKMLDNDDLDGYFNCISKIENTMFTNPQTVIEQQLFVAVAKGIYRQDSEGVRKCFNSINQYGNNIISSSLELSYLNSYLMKSDRDSANKIKDVFIKVEQNVKAKGTKIILQRQLNMMHPDDYRISFDEEILEDKVFGYAFYNGNKIYLLDAKMHQGAFVDNVQENGYIYGVFDDCLMIQTAYGLLSCEKVIYAGSNMNVKTFAEKYNIKGVVLK